jgi:hypothetical protein
MMRRLGLLLLLLASPAAAATATAPAPAKPTTTAKTAGAAAPPKAAQTCTIGSFKGTLIPGTTICAKIGGFVRVQGDVNGGRGAWQP